MTDAAPLIFNPCEVCIERLRASLFTRKDTVGTISYEMLKRYFVSKYTFDLYSNSIPKPSEGASMEEHMQYEHQMYKYASSHTVEHIVPSSIFASNVTSLNIHNEPAHEIHNLFICNPVLNDIRKKCHHGNVELEHASLCVANTVCLIKPSYGVSKKQFYKNPFFTEVHKIESFVDFPFSEEERNSIVCELYSKKECIFTPPYQNRGAIARCVFFMFLMYVYDPSKRPGLSSEHYWLYRNVPNIDKRTKKPIKDISKYESLPGWQEYFYEHLQEFYEWSKMPITEQEHQRNKNLIEICGYPNIFVGYMKIVDDDYVYTPAHPNTIDAILFNQSHDHYDQINECCTAIDKLVEHKVMPKILESDHPTHMYESAKISPILELSAHTDGSPILFVPYVKPTFPIKVDHRVSDMVTKSTSDATTRVVIDWPTKRALAVANRAEQIIRAKSIDSMFPTAEYIEQKAKRETERHVRHAALMAKNAEDAKKRKEEAVERLAKEKAASIARRAEKEKLLASTDHTKEDPLAGGKYKTKYWKYVDKLKKLFDSMTS